MDPSPFMVLNEPLFQIKMELSVTKYTPVLVARIVIMYLKLL